MKTLYADATNLESIEIWDMACPACGRTIRFPVPQRMRDPDMEIAYYKDLAARLSTEIVELRKHLYPKP